MVGRLSAGPPGLRTWFRRVAALALVAAVVVVHGCVVDGIAERMIDFGAVAAMPTRIEVAYVREMEPQAPPAAPARAAPAPRKTRVAAAPQRAASVPAPEAAPPEVPSEPSPPEPAPPPPPEPPPVAAVEAPPVPDVPSADANSAALGVAPPAAAASAPRPFAWPVSTRLTYILNGNYRGEIKGTAQVEWVRVGLRYQVHLDVTVGLSFAPLLTRHMTSEGRLTSEGLLPERYDEDSKVAFQDRRRATLLFEPDMIVMPNGARRERWPGTQDTASQFVQLSYLFTTQPELLTRGRVIEMPLALPRNVDRWVFDVLDTDTLHTPFGAVEAVHLKPRRVARPGGDLTAEIWFAPTLGYLPVRIRIEQDADTYIDLVIERKPQLATEKP